MIRMKMNMDKKITTNNPTHILTDKKFIKFAPNTLHHTQTKQKPIY